MDGELSRIFAPPSYIFEGTFRSACDLAVHRNCYVLLSILDSSFISTCVNRDLWRSHELSQILPSSVVLYQIVAGEGEEGDSLASQYAGPCPKVFVVNPLTRAATASIPLKKTNGTICPEDFLQRLIDVLDKKPPDFHETLDRFSSPTESRLAGLTAAVRDETAEDSPERKQQRTEEHALSREAVSIDQWRDENGLRLRIRIPEKIIEFSLKASVPVAVLQRFVSQQMAEASPEKYQHPPEVEFRCGFPPKPLGPSGSLESWGIRSNDLLLVHLK
jgi:hypothetical protein